MPVSAQGHQIQKVKMLTNKKTNSVIAGHCDIHPARVFFKNSRLPPNQIVVSYPSLK